MNLSQLAWSAIGFLLTVMVLSYLIGDNLFFRLAAYLFIGLTAGYLTVLLVNRVLLPHMVLPLISGSGPERWWLLVPLVLSLLLLIGQIPRLSLASRIPLAFLAGISAAIAIGGAVFGTLIPQAKVVIGAFDPAVIYKASEGVWLRILDAVVMLLGVIGTLSYFHFGRKLRPGKAEDDTKRPLALQGMSKVGEIFIGITLGAVFAGVFSTALLALIDRLIAIGDIVTQLLGGA